MNDPGICCEGLKDSKGRCCNANCANFDPYAEQMEVIE